MKATTPILRLKGDEYYSNKFRLCRDKFKEHALPSWTGPLPKRIRLHLDSSRRGKWDWDYFNSLPIGAPSGRRFTAYSATDDWMRDVFQTDHVFFNVEMEIIES